MFKKATTIVLALCCLMMCLSACSSKPQPQKTEQPDFAQQELPPDTVCQYISDNGKRTLRFTNNIKTLCATHELTGSPRSRPPRYTSIPEMLETFAAGDIPIEELLHIYIDGGKQDEVDFSHLYEPVLPEDLTVASFVLDRNTCEYVLDNTNGRIWKIDKSRYDTYSQIMQETFYGFDLEITSVKLIAERNAEETLYRAVGMTNTKTEFKKLVYDIPVDDGVLHICELYDFSSYSHTVPSRILFYGERNGIHFTGRLENLQERPTVEYLSSVSMIEYVEK